MIVPTTDESEGVATARRVAQCLPSTWNVSTAVVVDGSGTEESSSDEGRELLKLAQLGGSYRARNVGAEACIERWDPDFLVFADAGIDVELERCPDLMKGSLTGFEVAFDRPPETPTECWYQHNAFDSERFLATFGFVPTILVMVDARVFREVGGFDDELLSSGDVDFSRRVAQIGHVRLRDDLRAITSSRTFRPLMRKLRRQVYGQVHLASQRTGPVRFRLHIVARIAYHALGRGHRRYTPAVSGTIGPVGYRIAATAVSAWKVTLLVRALVAPRASIPTLASASNAREVRS